MRTAVEESGPQDYKFSSTKAFFANVVLCKGTSHGYAESGTAERIIDVKHEACTRIQTDIVNGEIPVGDSTANGSIERTNQTFRGQIRAVKDFTERQTGETIGLDRSVLKWLVRHTPCWRWRYDSSPQHQRQNIQSADCRVRQTNPFQATQDFGATTETRCELAGRLLARFQHEDERTHRE